MFLEKACSELIERGTNYIILFFFFLSLILPMVHDGVCELSFGTAQKKQLFFSENLFIFIEIPHCYGIALSGKLTTGLGCFLIFKIGHLVAFLADIAFELTGLLVECVDLLVHLVVGGEEFGLLFRGQVQFLDEKFVLELAHFSHPLFAFGPGGMIIGK